MKQLCTYTLLGLMALAWLSCREPALESGGAYAPAKTNAAGQVSGASPDYAFFVIDASYQVVWNTLNAAFTFEYNNRAYLRELWPQLKSGLDKIRSPANSANAAYLGARELYKASPSPAGLANMQTQQATLGDLSAKAQALLPSNAGAAPAKK